jgi:glycosyltransferase involved in cell wall biosynthesis
VTNHEAGLRVAFVSPCFWPEVKRGAERIVAELAQGLIAEGHRPRLITSHPGMPSSTVEDGVPIVRVPRPPEGRRLRREFEFYSTHAPLSYLALRAGDDQIAHSVFPTDAMAALRWSEKTGRPWVFHYMGIPAREALTARRRRLELTQRAANGATAVVALSRVSRDAFKRWLDVDAQVINPGVDLQAFQPAPARAEQPTIFSAAAADSHRKRVPMLVDAFKVVRRKHRKARLVLPRPGDPKLAASLEQASPGIELIPQVEDPAQLAAAYGEAWVSALPSWGEAFGVVLVESLACGTPVVATNRDAMPEIVDRDEVGRLFDGDHRDLSRALLEALELSQAPGTAEACRARAGDFSTERATQSWIELYRGML